MNDSNSSVGTETYKESPRPAPQSIRSTPESAPSTDGRLGWRELFWVPYAGLTIILITLACGSFCMYHRKNRDKYRDVAYKAKHNIYSSPKKYRVTLNRNGYVGCLSQTRRAAVNTAAGDNVIGRNAPKTLPVADAMTMTDIFTVTSLASNGNNEHAPYLVPDVRNYSYENEGYDANSNHGSDKSLLKRGGSAGETHFTNSDTADTIKKREYWFDKYKVTTKSTGAKRKVTQSDVQIEPKNVDTCSNHDQFVHEPTNENDVISGKFHEPHEKGQKRHIRTAPGTNPMPPANLVPYNNIEPPESRAHVCLDTGAVAEAT